MALINCPDCGTEVSDAAAACPKCARPIASAVAHVGSTPPTPPTPKKGAGVGSVLLVLLLVGGWVYYQTTVSSTPPADASTQTSDTLPSDTGAPPSSVKDRPAFVTTPADLYRAYSTNEVATDQALAGKVIQFTAPVKSIDKDFTDSAVLTFATGDDFNNLHATLKDNDKAAAAQLIPGQVVTVRCESFKRIIDSPMGNDCTFAVASGSDQSPAAMATSTASQTVAVDQPGTPVTAPAEESSALVIGTADDAAVGSSSGVSPNTQEGGANTTGPSFDCSKVTDATDLTICSNTELSQLDQQMAALYFARAQSGADPTARNEQRVWLHDRNQCGADAICLQKEYAARIQQLQQN